MVFFFMSKREREKKNEREKEGGREKRKEGKEGGREGGREKGILGFLGVILCRGILWLFFYTV